MEYGVWNMEKVCMPSLSIALYIEVKVMAKGGNVDHLVPLPRA